MSHPDPTQTYNEPLPTRMKEGNTMNEKQCFKCGSNSTVLDGKTWVCAEHISHCKCKRNHEASSEWDFRGTSVEDMEYSLPDIYEEEFMKRTHPTGGNAWVNFTNQKKDELNKGITN